MLNKGILSQMLSLIKTDDNFLIFKDFKLKVDDDKTGIIVASADGYLKIDYENG